MKEKPQISGKWNGLKRSPMNKKPSPRQARELAARTRLKKELMAEQEYPHCDICGGSGFPLGLTLAHIEPLSRGGKTTKANCDIECIPCHDKYEKKPEER